MKKAKFDPFHFSDLTLLKFGKVAIILLLGLAIAKVLKILTSNFLTKYRQGGRPSYLPDFIFYITFCGAIVVALDQFNVDIKLLLGTAGFLTVALGFASQTSVSNIISGFFLMTERPFTIGDTVKINELTGVILSIDLLSTRLRTVDNLLVRIPNETLMKANIINYTHFPLRRVDIEFRMSFQEKIQKIRNLLFTLAEDSTYCFDEPKPLFIIKEFGEYYFLVQFSFWVQKDNYVEYKNAFIEEMVETFSRFNITPPVPMYGNVQVREGSGSGPSGPTGPIGGGVTNPRFEKLRKERKKWES